MVNGLGDLTSGFTNFVEMLRCFGTWGGLQSTYSVLPTSVLWVSKAWTAWHFGTSSGSNDQENLYSFPSLLLTNCVNLGNTQDLTLHYRMKVLD